MTNSLRRLGIDSESGHPMLTWSPDEDSNAAFSGRQDRGMPRGLPRGVSPDPAAGPLRTALQAPRGTGGPVWSAREASQKVSAKPNPTPPSATPLPRPALFAITDPAGNWPVKDDLTSMEFPLFALSKSPTMEVRSYSRDGKSLTVIPSNIGAPTIFDKDLLIFIISQIARAINEGRPVSRRVRFDVYPFLVATRRSTGGAAYERVVDMLRRLRGSTIETNVKTTEDECIHGFGFIEDYRVVQRTRNDKGALELEVTASEWLYRAAMEFDVLTISPDYFSLAALERRVYELARKHCGDKPWWTVSLPVLQDKTGSTHTARRFRFDVKALVGANNIPDYRLGLDDSVDPSQLVVLTRDNSRLMVHASKANKVDWVAQFLRQSAP